MAKPDIKLREIVWAFNMAKVELPLLQYRIALTLKNKRAIREIVVPQKKKLPVCRHSFPGPTGTCVIVFAHHSS